MSSPKLAFDVLLVKTVMQAADIERHGLESSRSLMGDVGRPLERETERVSISDKGTFCL